MNRRYATSAFVVLAVAAGFAAASAQADTLLIERVEAAKNLPMPSRGLSMGDIEARRSDAARAQSPGQRIFVDDAAAGDVDEGRGGLHLGEFGGGDAVVGLG